MLYTRARISGWVVRLGYEGDNEGMTSPQIDADLLYIVSVGQKREASSRKICRLLGAPSMTARKHSLAPGCNFRLLRIPHVIDFEEPKDLLKPRRPPSY